MFQLNIVSVAGLVVVLEVVVIIYNTMFLFLGVIYYLYFAAKILTLGV